MVQLEADDDDDDEEGQVCSCVASRRQMLIFFPRGDVRVYFFEAFTISDTPHLYSFFPFLFSLLFSFFFSLHLGILNTLVFWTLLHNLPLTYPSNKDSR